MIIIFSFNKGILQVVLRSHLTCFRLFVMVSWTIGGHKGMWQEHATYMGVFFNVLSVAWLATLTQIYVLYMQGV